MTQQPHTNVRRTQFPESSTTPVVPPLVGSVVFRARDADELDAVYEGGASGFTYAREGSPNAELLASKIAEAEGAETGLVTCSGMAAASATLLGLLGAGDHLVAGDALYGRTHRLAQSELPRLGIETDLVDASDAGNVAQAIRPNTRVILVEVISNPLLRVADVEGLATIANENDVLLVVDNTFPTSLGFQPLAWNADLVLHSVTKMLAGHSDVTLGAVCGASEIVERIRETVVTFGFNPSPYDCWLAERGMNTIELRHARSEENAAALANFFAEQPAVRRVFYPGRDDHPDHETARRLFGEHFGAMVSFELDGGRNEVNRFLRALENIPFAPTLGDVATMVSHPASSSHRGLSPDQRKALGIEEGLIRVSAGIEQTEVLRDEFAEALQAVQG